MKTIQQRLSDRGLSPLAACLVVLAVAAPAHAAEPFSFVALGDTTYTIPEDNPVYEKLIAAMSGLVVDTPFGPITYRAIDHQSTMGAYVGQIGVKDGKGVMTTFKYAPGDKYLPTDAEVKKMRPAD